MELLREKLKKEVLKKLKLTTTKLWVFNYKASQWITRNLNNKQKEK